jgi:hypothetical protein
MKQGFAFCLFVVQWLLILYHENKKYRLKHLLLFVFFSLLSLLASNFSFFTMTTVPGTYFTREQLEADLDGKELLSFFIFSFKIS